MEIAIWLCLLFVVHTYLGYPLWLAMRTRRHAAPAPASELPQGGVAVIISARNEEAVLPAKIQNLLSSTVADRIREIWVGSDGSTDHTAERCEAIADPRIQVRRFSPPQGKASVLNALAQRTSAPYLLLCDARQLFEPDALEHLLRRLADPEVGVVSGELLFRASGEAEQSGMGAYWHYEKWIRERESLIHSVPGSTGAITLMRRELFRPLLPDTLLDDVSLPMHAIASGKRCVLERRAIAWDTASPDVGKEGIRKRRTLAGNLQLWFRNPSWTCPGKHPAWWAFLQHKIFRLLVPFALLAALALNLLLLGTSGIYLVLLAAQTSFYLLAALGALLPTPAPLLRVPQLFVGLNWAALLAWGDALTGKYQAAWQQSTKDSSP